MNGQQLHIQIMVYYKLEENNTKIIKISENGTITIYRGIKNLEKGNIYTLDYFINYKDGDFDIGFGDDSIGSTCWLRGNKCYCVSNEEIYVNGAKKNSNNHLKDYKKIILLLILLNFHIKFFLMIIRCLILILIQN